MMEYKEFSYIMDGGRFILCEGKDWIGDPNVYELWFMVDAADVDEGMCTLMKHGKKENVEKYYNEYVGKMKENGFDDMVKSVMMIEVTKLDLDEINKCITSSGYVSKFVKALQGGEQKQIENR